MKLSLSLMDMCEHGCWRCRECERVSEPKNADSTYSICSKCGAYNSLEWIPPAFEPEVKPA